MIPMKPEKHVYRINTYKIGESLFAERLGKDRTTVSKWCSNGVQPSLETVFEFAQCLGVGVEEHKRMLEKKEGGE